MGVFFLVSERTFLLVVLTGELVVDERGYLCGMKRVVVGWGRSWWCRLSPYFSRSIISLDAMIFEKIFKVREVFAQWID